MEWISDEGMSGIELGQRVRSRCPGAEGTGTVLREDQVGALGFMPSPGELWVVRFDDGREGRVHREWLSAETRYHPDPAIDAEIAAEALESERVDLAMGYPPRRWQCECGASHGRGHFMTVGVHRCLACGYVGPGGVMFGTSNPTPPDARHHPPKSTG